MEQFEETRMELVPKISEVEAQSYESRELDKLYGSLAKAQLDMEIAKTDASNPYFKSKYADLTSIVKASRKYLASNGLAVLQRILPNGNGKDSLHTRLCHASGQWIESKMPIAPVKNDVQSTGSYITYLRRYCYAAIVGVVAEDEDDDGEKEMQTARREDPKMQPAPETISKAQLQILSQELEGQEEILESILKGYKIVKLSDMLAKNYTPCILKIKDIKRAKEA
jgi:hypothetical protein